MTNTPRATKNSDLGNVARSTKRGRPKKYAGNSKHESLLLPHYYLVLLSFTLYLVKLRDNKIEIKVF